ncbi:hypothetical protein M422DRAFT_51989, partial [Sphaerobolus stellatus SS14]
MTSSSVPEETPLLVTFVNDVQPSCVDKEEVNSDVEVVSQPTVKPHHVGYVWLVVFCGCFANVLSWGFSFEFGVLLNCYTTNHVVLGATSIDLALIGAISGACAVLIVPLADFLSERFTFKVALTIGVLFYVLSLVSIPLSTAVWQLYLTQGIMFGFALGL